MSKGISIRDDLPTIKTMLAIPDRKRPNNIRHNRGYRQGARHMISDIIDLFEHAPESLTLEYLQEQLKKIPGDKT